MLGGFCRIICECGIKAVSIEVDPHLVAARKTNPLPGESSTSQRTGGPAGTAAAYWRRSDAYVRRRCSMMCSPSWLSTRTTPSGNEAPSFSAWNRSHSRLLRLLISTLKSVWDQCPNSSASSHFNSKHTQSVAWMVNSESGLTCSQSKHLMNVCSEVLGQPHGSKGVCPKST